MGLDTVELVIATERAFEISISDEEAARIATVRDLAEYVYSKVPHANSRVCLTQRAFHRLRRAARAGLGVRRDNVRPSTRLDEMLPLRGRIEDWNRLKDAIGMPEWPTLRRSRQTVMSIAAASATTALAAAALAPAFNLGAAIVGGIMTWTLLAGATKSLRLHFAAPLQTIGQLAEFVATHAGAPLVCDKGGWTHEQVRLTVRKLVADQLGIEPTFSDDARIVDDLGAD